VNAWLVKSETDEHRIVAALIGVADARARRERNTYLRMAGQYIRPAEVAAAWAVSVAHVRRTSLAWLAALPARLRAIHTAPPASAAPPHRFIRAAELSSMLDAAPAPHPWPSAACPGLRARASSSASWTLR
jgi:hypothetical protein